jgi:hypothetical protein
VLGPKLSLFSDVPKDASGHVDETERILGESDDYSCAPIHVAVVNAYHHGRMDGICRQTESWSTQNPGFVVGRRSGHVGDMQ